MEVERIAVVPGTVPQAPGVDFSAQRETPQVCAAREVLQHERFRVLASRTLSDTTPPQSRNVIRQPFAVLRSLEFNRSQRITRLLCFDHANRRAVNVKEVVGETVAFLERVSADRDALGGSEIRFLARLDRRSSGQSSLSISARASRSGAIERDRNHIIAIFSTIPNPGHNKDENSYSDEKRT